MGIRRTDEVFIELSGEEIQEVVLVILYISAILSSSAETAAGGGSSSEIALIPLFALRGSSVSVEHPPSAADETAAAVSEAAAGAGGVGLEESSLVADLLLEGRSRLLEREDLVL